MRRRQGRGTRLHACLLTALACLQHAAAVTTFAPDGVHTFSPAAGQLLVSWTTFTDDAVNASGVAGAVVSYGLSPTDLRWTATGRWGLLVDGARNPLRTYDVVLRDLAPATTYFYRPGGVNLTVAGAATFNTTTPPRTCVSAGGVSQSSWYATGPSTRLPCTSASPRVYGVLADFGLTNAVSMPALYQDALDSRFSSLILAGDMAYDLNSNLGLTGVNWFEMMEAVVARYPLIACAGNHESAAGFRHYTTRFSGVAATAGAASGSNSSRYYAFVDGLIQFIALDSEFWFYNGTAAEIAAQDAWIRGALAGVDRTVTPWVVVLMHKAFWMDSTNLTSLEPLLYAGGVDLIIVGHSHNYQRLMPLRAGRVVETGCVSADKALYFNCSGTTTLVVGAPGCREGISSGLARTSYLAASRLLYGYGYLTVHNWTHLQWGWAPTGYPNASNDVPITPPPGFDGRDAAWIIKPRNAPPLVSYADVYGPAPPSPSASASATGSASAMATVTVSSSSTASPSTTPSVSVTHTVAPSPSPAATPSPTLTAGGGGAGLAAGLGASGTDFDGGLSHSAMLRIAVGSSAGGVFLVALVCYALRRRAAAARAVRRNPLAVRGRSGSNTMLYSSTDRRPSSVGSIVRGGSFSALPVHFGAPPTPAGGFSSAPVPLSPLSAANPLAAYGLGSKV